MRASTKAKRPKHRETSATHVVHRENVRASTRAKRSKHRDQLFMEDTDEKDKDEYFLRGHPDNHNMYLPYITDSASGETRVACYAEATGKPGGKEVINEVIAAGDARRSGVGLRRSSSTMVHTTKPKKAVGVWRDTPACPAWLESECYAAMHSLLADMAAFTMGKVCIAGSFALIMYNRSRGLEVDWSANDVDVWFLANGEKQRETLLLIAEAFFQSWIEDSTTTVQSGVCEYSKRSHCDATDGEVAAWRLREKLSHMVSKESADNETCAAA